MYIPFVLEQIVMQNFQERSLAWVTEQSVFGCLRTVHRSCCQWLELFLHHETINYTGIQNQSPDGNENAAPLT